MKKFLIYLLLIPFLIILLLWDLVKIPIIIIISPIWLLISIIYWLKGDEFEFFIFIRFALFMGIMIWMEMVGINIPKWMDDQ